MVAKCLNAMRMAIKNPNEAPGTKKVYSDALNLLRFPLAVVVVSVHIFAAPFPMREELMENSWLFREVNDFVFSFLRSQSVPIYFFISGYVFFLGITLDRATFKRKLKNRFQSLFIPFVIWNLLMLGMHMAQDWLSPSEHTPLNLSVSGFLNIFWNSDYCIYPLNEHPGASSIYPVNGPLWFLRDLMIIVLLTPAINWLTRRLGLVYLSITGILYLVMSYLSIKHVGQLSTALFFFSWGAYMSIKQIDMLEAFGRLSTPSYVLYFLLAIVCMFALHYCPDAYKPIKTLNIFVGMLFAYNLALTLIRRYGFKSNELLASASFFIYISHRLLWSPILKAMVAIIHPTTGLTGVSVYVLTLLLTISILLLAFWLMRKFTPSLLKVIAGRK